MKRTQEVTTLLQPHLTFVEEWDDEESEDVRVHRVVRVIDRSTGKNVTTQKEGDRWHNIKIDGSMHHDPDLAKQMHDDAMGMSRHSNLVMRPAMLAALPAKHKVKNKEGEEEFAVGEPKWMVENGEVVAKFPNEAHADFHAVASAIHAKHKYVPKR